MKRFEKKYSYSPIYNEFLHSQILALGFIEVFEKRIVSSIYYDDDKFSLYQESIDGLGNRNKFRIRFYNQDTNNLTLEKKIRINDYGMKEFKEIKNDLIPLEIYDSYFSKKSSIKIPMNILNIYKPVIITKYERSYFSLSNDSESRITLDKNIRFGSVYLTGIDSLKVNINIPFENNIMEVKSNFNNEFLSGSIIKELNYFYLQNERSSKYCNAIESLY